MCPLVFKRKMSYLENKDTEEMFFKLLKSKGVCQNK